MHHIHIGNCLLLLEGKYEIGTLQISNMLILSKGRGMAETWVSIAEVI